MTLILVLIKLFGNVSYGWGIAFLPLIIGTSVTVAVILFIIAIFGIDAIKNRGG